MVSELGIQSIGHCMFSPTLYRKNGGSQLALCPLAVQYVLAAPGYSVAQQQLFQAQHVTSQEE